MKTKVERSDESSEIERFHESDIAAARLRDFKALRALVSDDAVILPDGGGVVKGESAIDRWFVEMKKSLEEFDVLAYSMEFEDVQVLGEYAFEWGYAHESARNRRTGELEKSTSRLFRVLRKEKGRWKVYRTIWNQGQVLTVTKRER